MLAPSLITSSRLASSSSASCSDIVVGIGGGGGCLLKVINKPCSVMEVSYILIYKVVNHMNSIVSSTKIYGIGINMYLIRINLYET